MREGSRNLDKNQPLKDGLHESPIHTFAICAYKDSPYLEACIRSLKGQTVTADIICCTSTPSPFLAQLTKKYDIPLFVRHGESNIKEDWLFAYRMAKGRLVTIAHQDDIYRKDYGQELLKAFRRYPDLTVFASDYLTLKMTERGTKVEVINPVWLVKKILRLPLRLHFLAHLKPVKRSSVVFGNSICCPACTYHKARIGEQIFQSDYDFALDWDNLYELAGREGRFICAEKPLFAYRVHEGATTKACIEDNRREEEEQSMFQKMWPDWLVGVWMHFYKKAYDEYEKDE